MYGFDSLEQLRTFIANEVMFTSEAARFLGVSPQRLNQLVQSGKLMPVKVNRTGSLFLIKDLEIRKKELERAIAVENKKKSNSNIRFGNEPKVIQEAINYYTIRTALKLSDKKVSPIIDQLKNQIDFTIPFSEKIKEVAKLIKCEPETLRKSYQVVENGFNNLLETDYVVKKGQDLYPSLLEQTKEAPPFLFMRGNIRLLQYPIIAVVGTRKPTEEGTKKAWNLARLLGKNRIVVASGLAKGIDTSAHNGALNNQYPTIAVLGTPLTKVYPKENENLQKQISEEGLLISQFHPSAEIQRWNFPMRNAIMSGISLATVIVEAGETSGALIQADYALKQKRLVFIPESALNNNKILWPKKYIARDGAESFSKISELIEKLGNSKIIPEIRETFEQLTLNNFQVGTHYVHRSE